ncbi:MAG: NHL repeat-containing protein [Acidimicrobiales bacterium]
MSVERRYVQGDDPAMQSLLAAASTRNSGLMGGLGMVTETFGTLHEVSPGVVDVPVTFDVQAARSHGATYPFTATAVRSAGRWMVSWATECTIVESSGTICPKAPRGVRVTIPAPTDNPATVVPPLDPGLVRPSGLVVEPDGGLLIADTDRNQVLQRSPSGTLSVFAGTGADGTGGDGGPAVDAQLDLTGLSDLAIAPDGTVYIAGNHDIRAVSPSGIITTVAGDGTGGQRPTVGVPATDVSLDQPCVAVAANGTLYIGDGSSIYELTSNGTLSVLVAGGPPYGVDVSTSTGSTAFFPTAMAFDGAGNLDVFSFSPKDIVQVSPSGAVTVLGPDYATQLASAPDGTVLVGSHGTSIQRIVETRIENVLSFGPGTIAGFGLPGVRQGFQPDGVAEAANGTTYADTWVGNGYASQVALIQITPAGRASVLPVSGSISSNLPPLGAPGYPTTTYPKPVPARSGTDISSCPSPQGLVPFDAAAKSAAQQEAAGFDASLATSLADADRSWWDAAYLESVDPADSGRHSVVQVEPASNDFYAPIVTRACGRALLAHSLAIVVGPSPYSFAVVSHFFFVDRSGRPLVYYQNE